VADAGIVGREAELEAIDAFLDGVTASQALVLTGRAGIGKTALWEASVVGAHERGMRVLSTRASEAEARLSLAALTDLLEGVDLSGLGLPPPQQDALEVALLRAAPAGSPPEARAIGLGFLNAVRALADRGTVLVAVDDVHWLDPASADVLAFAARRLVHERIAFLLAKRPATSSAFERELERKEATRLEVGPLSLGATRRLLFDRLGLSLPRHLLRRVHEATLGNPLFTLEIGRSLADQSEAIKEIPVPETVEELLGIRVARLPAPTRRLLLALALSGDLRTSQLARMVDPATVDDAVDRGLVVVEGDRVRPSHPLLPAAARRRSRVAERRELHRELAGIVGDEELQALHLALATELPDAQLSARLAAASTAAAARGARLDAAELAEHALRLAPADGKERDERLLALAEDLVLAGEPQRATDLLAPELEALPAGATRARAWIILAGGAIRRVDDLEHCLEQALAESGDDPRLRVSLLARLADHTAVIRVTRVREAELRAEQALSEALLAGPEEEQLALYALSWARSLRGLSIDDICERFAGTVDDSVPVTYFPERVAGQRLVWRGEIDAARALLTRLLAIADERCEPYSYALLRLHLCELELRVGAFEAADGLLAEWAADREILVWPMFERCRALLAAGRGLTEEADGLAAQAVTRAEETGNRWDLLEALRARGVAALLRDPAAAAQSFRAVWEHTLREGVEEPGVFPVTPDLVEALIALGEQDEARAVTARLRELAERQEHPWGLVTARRCDALIELALGYDEGAAAELSLAATGYGELGLRFDQARVLLTLGRLLRRHRKWRASRASLEQAASVFDERGSPGWAEAARSELARVSARRPRPAGELTEAERRVVELAVEGLSNKEIAQALVVTVPTVEGHLSKAYAKLGVRSRAQLGARLSACT
jgi:DNA-binding CsgD family transcriptional regulator